MTYVYRMSDCVLYFSDADGKRPTITLYESSTGISTKIGTFTNESTFKQLIIALNRNVPAEMAGDLDVI